MDDLIKNLDWIWAAYAYVMLILMATLLSHKDKKWDIFFTFLFPICITTPLVFLMGRLDTLDDPGFTYSKLYAVLFSAACVWYIRNNPKTVWGKKIRIFSFAVNILIACVAEFKHGFIINPLAGLLILATLPRWKSLRVEGEDRKLLWESPLLWVLAYSIWNVSFFTNLYPSLWYLNITHVLIALFLVFKNPAWYAQIRAVSLNICLSLMIAFLPALEILLANEKHGPFNSMTIFKAFVLYSSIAALILSILTIAEQVYKKKGRIAALLKIEKVKY